MRSSDRHITFARQQDSPRTTQSTTAGRVDAGLEPQSNSGKHSMRKLFACFPASNIADDSLAAAQCEYLDQLMSADFQDFIAEQLGCRRLTVNAGPLIDQAKGSMNGPWSTSAALPSAGTTTSSKESLAFDLAHSPPTTASQRTAGISGNAGLEETLKEEWWLINREALLVHNPVNGSTAVDYGLHRAIDDELCDKTLIEIHRGKGGMFTKSVYSCRSWLHLRDNDLGESNAVLIFIQPVNQQSCPSQVGIMVGDGGRRTQLMRVPNNGVPMEWLILVESVVQRKRLFVVCATNESAHTNDSELLSTLKRLHGEGLLCLVDSFADLMKVLTADEMKPLGGRDFGITAVNIYSAKDAKQFLLA